jgi:hypothetical protein
MSITLQEIVVFVLAAGLFGFFAYCIIASRRTGDKDHKNDKK